MDAVEYLEKHSSGNGCVALTRSERDKLIGMIEELKNQIKLIESVSDANADMIEKMKCCGNCKFCEIDGTFCYAYKQEKGYVEKCSRWELAE